MILYTTRISRRARPTWTCTCTLRYRPEHRLSPTYHALRAVQPRRLLTSPPGAKGPSTLRKPSQCKMSAIIRLILARVHIVGRLTRPSQMQMPCTGLASAPPLSLTRPPIADSLAASHWSSSIDDSPKSFNTPIFFNSGPKSRDDCSSSSTSWNRFLYTKRSPYSPASLIVSTRRVDPLADRHNSRLKVPPVDNVLRHVPHRIFQVEPVLVPVYPLMLPLGELDVVTAVAEAQLRLVRRDFIQLRSGISLDPRRARRRLTGAIPNPVSCR